MPVHDPALQRAMANEPKPRVAKPKRVTVELSERQVAALKAIGTDLPYAVSWCVSDALGINRRPESFAGVKASSGRIDGPEG